MPEINDKEAKIVVSTNSGLAFKNSSTAGDIKDAQELIGRLKTQISHYAKHHSDVDPLSMEYRYGIGNLMYTLSHEEGVTNEIRKLFFKEIEEMTSIDDLVGRPLGKGGSDNRHPYLETCYWFRSKFSKTLVLSLTWSDWSELYSRPKIRDDSRIAQWVSDNKSRLTRNTIREILKSMTYYVEEHDLSFLDDEDINEELERAFLFETTWNNCLKKYFEGKTENLSPARRNNQAKYKEKYLRRCYDDSMFSGLDEAIPLFEKAFEDIYVNV